jgi:LysM repeat protein
VKIEVITADGLTKKRAILYNYHVNGDSGKASAQKKENLYRIKNISEVKNENASLKKFIYHRVENGESLWKIAQKYDIALEDLIRYNNIKNPDLILRGSTLKILF